MRLRLLVASLVLVLPSVAHADLVARALAAGDEGGGGGGSAAPAAPAPPDDLIAWAGAPQAITLPELLQISLRQAPALASAKLDIAVAEAQVEQTWSRHDWLVRAQATGSHTSGGVFGGIKLDGTTDYGLTGDLSRALPTGGTVDLHAGSSYNKTSSMLGTSTSWSDDVTVSVTQHLLAGRGEALYDAAERRIRLSRDVAVLARRLVAIQTVQAIVSAYWDLVLAERQVAITDASLALARERLRVTEIGAIGGKIAKAEIPAVQQIIATREEDVLGGELGVLDRSIALRRAVGMTIGPGELGLRVATDLDTLDRGWTIGGLLERAYTASPELAELAKDNDSATIEIAVTENGLLPQLDAALSFGPTGVDTAFGTAAKNLVELKQLSISGSLTFQRSLGQHDIRGRAREQRIARDKLRVNAIDLRAQIAQTLARAVAQIEVAKRRAVLSQRAIELADENIRIETDRFNLGKSTNFDVLNRLEEKRQAELRAAQTMVDWHKAETVVMALTGDLLPSYGIAVD